MSEDRISAYIETMPEEHQPLLHELRDMIDNALGDNAETQFMHGFPVWVHGDDYLAGFASRKDGVRFYLMKTKIVDAWEDRLGKLRVGKSCIRYKPNRKVGHDSLKKIAEGMLADLVKEHDYLQ